MNWGNPKSWFSSSLNEEIKAFKNKDEQLSVDQLKKQSGEGMYDVSGYGSYSAGSFNNFYNKYINTKHTNTLAKLSFYREMANNPEIDDVLDDAVNESLQENEDGKVITLKFVDDELAKKENVTKNVEQQFEDLFYDRINIQDSLPKWYYRYLVDTEIYTENVINESKQKEGILKVKLLPVETMDEITDEAGQIIGYVQYKKKGNRKALTVEQAKHDKDVNFFYPGQINHLKYGHGNKTNAYLSSSKVPYNQLKLLETSLIIYRIVRAPERFVFKIDTGNMPREKAMKYVEKIKQKMNRKESFDAETGTLTKSKDVLCIRQNTEIKLLDGRSLPLTEIIKEFNDGKENWVYTVNQDTFEIEAGKISNAKINRLNEKLVRVHLDDGGYVDTTYDHKFVMRDGSEKRADKLKENDSLMPLYTKHDKINKKYKQDYEYVYDLKTNKWVTTHKMVCESTDRKRGKQECIHHVDHNPFNNNPDNLNLMNFKEHIKYHGKHAKKIWEENYDYMYKNVTLKGRATLKADPIAMSRMKEKLVKFWDENYEHMCEVRKEQFRKLKQDPEWVKWKKETTAYWNKKLNKVEKLLEGLNVPDNRLHQKKRVSEFKKEYFQDPENRKRQGIQMKLNQENNKEAFDLARRQPKSDIHKQKLSKSVKANWNDPLFREKHTKINRERYKNDLSLSSRISKTQQLKFDNEIWGAIVETYSRYEGSTLKELSQVLSNDDVFISKWAVLNEDNQCVKDRLTVGCLLKIINRQGYNGYNDFRKNIKYNHKVTKIEYLDERDDTGCITVEGNHNFAVSFNGKSTIFVKNSIMDNFFIPQGENRGSDIDTIGGNTGAFGEMDDIFYFQKKLYRALKYPISRIENRFENRSADNLFQGTSFDEITRDEIKWSKFLEKQQRKFSEYLMRIFLIHLDFVGMKSQFGLTAKLLNIIFTPPSDYREQMKQRLLETQFNNYSSLSNEEEFSKYYLMRRFLGWTDEEIKENAEGMKKDKELGLKPDSF